MNEHKYSNPQGDRAACSCGWKSESRASASNARRHHKLHVEAVRAERSR